MRPVAEIVHVAEQPHEHDRCPQGAKRGDVIRCQCGRLGLVEIGDFVEPYVQWWRSQRRLRRKVSR